ncbi:hypothetical protein [Streptomyces sp. NBC_01187]|uniref:hypothetical protein n=1 Tax=Streptomyces sp. NBC_01187 TaxID=2903766 RepID=UPI003867D639|nr:hypothetical protein OG220_42165 [Streptomyces sp. NBC_01187]
MTKSGSTGPKTRARARQQRGRGKYTEALHESGARTSPDCPPPVGRVFFLADLLAECTGSPGRPTGEAGAPGLETFESNILGRPVPTTTVLSLTGALAQQGLGARLTVESSQGHSIVVTTQDENPAARWEMGLMHGVAKKLCPAPGCSDYPFYQPFIPVCLAHLPECGTAELLRMARDWALAHRGLWTVIPIGWVAARRQAFSYRPALHRERAMRSSKSC